MKKKAKATLKTYGKSLKKMIKSKAKPKARGKIKMGKKGKANGY